MSFVVCRLSFVVCRLSFVVCRLSFVVCRLSTFSIKDNQVMLNKLFQQERTSINVQQKNYEQLIDALIVAQIQKE